MEKTDFYLLIDVGTGSSRVALIDENKKIYDIQHVKNIYQKDKYGGMFINFELFLNNIALASKRVLETFDVEISAITVSGARQTFFCLNEKKQVIFGIPNIDNRGTKYQNKFSKVQDFVFSRTAKYISGDFLAMKLIGLREECPNLFEKIYSFTSLSEVFALLFCNQLIIEPSQAAETQLFNIFNKNWDKDLIEIFDLNAIHLPKIVNSKTIYDITNKQLLKKFGIEGPHCKFVVGGADTQLALKAVLKTDVDNALCLISGTTSPVNIRVKQPSIHGNHWLDLDLGGKDYILEYNPGVTGLNYEKIKRELLPTTSYLDIEKQIDMTKIQSVYASLTTQTFPITGQNKRIGGFFITPPVNEQVTKEALVGSVAIDIGYAIALKVNQLREDLNFEVNKILAAGGGMNSIIIPQIISTLTNLPVYIYENFQEPSIMGCFEIISSAFDKKRNYPDSKIRFEYYPQEDDTSLKTSYEIWKQLNKNITKN